MDDQKYLPSMDRLADLQQLIADFAAVQRVPKLPGTDRYENDVEHGFGLALTCWYLAPKIAPELDLGKLLQYALAHDIIEIYSGDTFAFDTANISTKSKREADALTRLEQEWPDFAEMTQHITGYQNKQDAEARFVYVIDKILPSVMVKLGEDADFWTKHKVTRQMHETEKNNKMRYSPEALPYLELLNAWMRDPDNFYKPT